MGLAVAFLSAAGLAASGIVWAQTPPCGALTNSYGPFDYRTSKAELKIVEDYHFTPDVETLRHGNTATVGGDIDYTLRASPNHHRALMSMVNLAVRTKSDKPLGPRLTVDCYFDRAMRQRVAAMLERHIVPGGYLFLSHAETLNGLDHSLHQVGPAVYQRSER